jgi:hypothetical protein
VHQLVNNKTLVMQYTQHRLFFPMVGSKLHFPEPLSLTTPLLRLLKRIDKVQKMTDQDYQTLCIEK